MIAGISNVIQQTIIATPQGAKRKRKKKKERRKEKQKGSKGKERNIKKLSAGKNHSYN